MQGCFFNRNSAIFIFSCETGGKHKDSVHRLSPASPLHSVSPLGPPNVFLLLFAWHWAPCYPSWTFPDFMYQYKCQPHPLPWIKEQTCTRADPRSPGTVLIPNRGGSTRTCHPLQGNPVPLEAAAAFYEWVSRNSQVLALLWIVMLFISICCAVFFFPLLIWHLCLVLYLTSWLLTYLVYLSAWNGKYQPLTYGSSCGCLKLSSGFF